jgi:hypothetical protein
VTSPPPGNGEPAPLATLAVRVDVLRRDVESLAVQLETLSSTQREHAAALGDMADLRRQVEQILALLTEDDGPPGEWFWLTMNEQQLGEKLGELSDWVETVLRPQYPGYLAGQIRPCWPHHPEARWELTWLYQLWTQAYLTKRPSAKDAADWHDRWSPGVIHRLSEAMRPCAETCQRPPAADPSHHVSR